MSEDFLAALVFGLFCLAVTLYALREWEKLQDERIGLMRRICFVKDHLYLIAEKEGDSPAEALLRCYPAAIEAEA